jgi:hypothetical protein
MNWEIKGDKPKWEDMKRMEIWDERNVMKERKISRQRQNTVRERGGGNWFGIKIYMCIT